MNKKEKKEKKRVQHEKENKEKDASILEINVYDTLKAKSVGPGQK